MFKVLALEFSLHYDPFGYINSSPRGENVIMEVEGVRTN